MSKDNHVKKLIELAVSLSEDDQEKLACVAQGMVIGSGVMAEQQLAAQRTASA